ncbi:MAG: endonuclease [Segetibacter sp.]|nr:endonuclease [Segetibacter sp.]
MTEQNTIIPRDLIFEVFKRDNFKCVFCEFAPYVKAQKIIAKERVFRNNYTLDNLVTTCHRCIQDGVCKEHYKNCQIIPEEYLIEMPNRNDQRSTMIECQKHIPGHSIAYEELSDYWTEVVGDYKLNNNELHNLRNLVHKFSFYTVKDAMDIVYIQFLRKLAGNVSSDQIKHAFSKIEGIANVIADPAPMSRS